MRIAGITLPGIKRTSCALCAIVAGLAGVGPTGAQGTRTPTLRIDGLSWRQQPVLQVLFTHLDTDQRPSLETDGDYRLRIGGRSLEAGAKPVPFETLGRPLDLVFVFSISSTLRNPSRIVGTVERMARSLKRRMAQTRIGGVIHTSVGPLRTKLSANDKALLKATGTFKSEGATSPASRVAGDLSWALKALGAGEPGTRRLIILIMDDTGHSKATPAAIKAITAAAGERDTSIHSISIATATKSPADDLGVYGRQTGGTHRHARDRVQLARAVKQLEDEICRQGTLSFSLPADLWSKKQSAVLTLDSGRGPLTSAPRDFTLPAFEGKAARPSAPRSTTPAEEGSSSLFVIAIILAVVVLMVLWIVIHMVRSRRQEEEVDGVLNLQRPGLQQHPAARRSPPSQPTPVHPAPPVPESTEDKTRLVAPLPMPYDDGSKTEAVSNPLIVPFDTGAETEVVPDQVIVPPTAPTTPPIPAPETSAPALGGGFDDDSPTTRINGPEMYMWKPQPPAATPTPPPPAGPSPRPGPPPIPADAITDKKTRGSS